MPLVTVALAKPEALPGTAVTAPVAYDDPDAVTVLVALDTGDGVPMMTKTWSAVPGGAECRPYDNAWLFRVAMFSVATFASLCAVLMALKRMSSACIIRAALLPHANPMRTYRRLHDRDGEKATFVDVLRRWVLLDFDEYKIADFPDMLTDPQGCAADVRRMLPPGLRNVACFWSFSSSTWMKKGKLGIHFYFLLENPLGWRDCEAFIAACHADVAMSRAVQVHYVAAPIFVPPINDPLRVRFGTFTGLDRVPAAVVTDLMTTGHALLNEQSPARSRATRRATPESPEGVHEPASGMIGDGNRHRHLTPIAGFARSRGLDATGLRDVLHAENANHCDPALDPAKIEALARSFAHYKVNPDHAKGTTWSRAVAAVAGLIRHNACPAAMEAMAGCILGSEPAGEAISNTTAEATAKAIVAAVLAMPKWKQDCAETTPGMMLPDGSVS